MSQKKERTPEQEKALEYAEMSVEHVRDSLDHLGKGAVFALSTVSHAAVSLIDALTNLIKEDRYRGHQRLQAKEDLRETLNHTEKSADAIRKLIRDIGCATYYAIISPTVKNLIKKRKDINQNETPHLRLTNPNETSQNQGNNFSQAA